VSIPYRRVTIPSMTRRFVSILSIVVLATALGACTPAASTGPTPATSGATAVPAGAIGVSGLVHAGPTCPVVRPGDSSCADRPVAGAVLVVTTASGTEVARATSAADGTFSVALPPGDYVLVPQPVAGLMGTAQPIPFHAQADGAAPAPLDVAYDTGIR
jgi:hypothetical protein